MIFYFSATGNSQYTAEKIADKLGQDCNSIQLYNKDKAYNFDVSSNEPIIIISPTYAWGLPKPMIEFLKKVKFNLTGEKYICFIATYGTTPGNIGLFANEILKERSNITFDAFFSVKMPDTWTPIFDLSNKDKVTQINNNANDEINNIISNIQNRIKLKHMNNSTPKFTKIVHKPFYNYLRKTKKFSVLDSCIGCGLCEKNCPINAIKIINGKPIWIKEECVMCLGCLHHCPKFSIQYGRNTKKHGQYLHYKYKK